MGDIVNESNEGSMTRVLAAVKELLLWTSEERAAELIETLTSACVNSGAAKVMEVLTKMAARGPRAFEAPSFRVDSSKARVVTPEPDPMPSAVNFVDYSKLPRYVDQFGFPAYVTPAGAPTYNFTVQDHTGAAMTCSADGCHRQATQFSYASGKTTPWCADHSPFSFKYPPSLG